MTCNKFLNCENNINVFNIRVDAITVWEHVHWKVARFIRQNKIAELTKAGGFKSVTKYLGG